MDTGFVLELEKTIRARELLPRGEPALIAVSGGADSMALMVALAALAEGNRWVFVAAHLNHGLRGSESDADELFAGESARALGLEFVSERADVGGYARKEKISVEMAAREARHGFLARTAAARRIRRIVLAHHANDQLELFFLRVLRGAGTEGLGGMDWVGASPSDPERLLVRPLLEMGRERIEAFCREGEIGFREDASNQCWDHLRNRIRHELAPMLMGRYQPALVKTIGRTMAVLREESRFMDQTARIWRGERGARGFDELAAAIQRRVLRDELIEEGITPNFSLIEDLRQSAGRVITAATGKHIWRDGEGRILVRSDVPRGFRSEEVSVELGGGTGCVRLGPMEIRWAVMAGGLELLGGSGAGDEAGGAEFFDYEKVGRSIRVRFWRPGDRFEPIGLGRAAKLQDLFVNSKAPREERYERGVAATEAGEIFWVQGLRISESFKLDNGTKWSLKWVCRCL